MKKRRTYSPEFKSKVALEALRENKPIHEIAQRYQLHPTQVTQWKKVLLDQAAGVFESDRGKLDESLRRKSKEDRLYKNIGQLQMEVAFLKDSCEKLGVIIPEDELH